MKLNRVLLIIIFLIFSIARFVASLPVGWTWVPDEAWYASSADSFFHTFEFLINGRFNAHTLPLYSIFISPAYFFDTSTTTFTIIKLMNSFVMTSAIFPVYLLSREFLDAKKSLIVACLSVMIGPMIYSFAIMAESLHYPLITWALYLMHHSLTKAENARSWDMALGMVFGLCLLNKMSSLAVVVSYVLIFITNELREFLHSKESTGIISRVFLRHKYVLLFLFLTILPYSIYRVGATTRSSPIPYTLAWLTYFNNFKDMNILKMFQWLITYLGQLNLSTGLCLLSPCLLAAVSFYKSDRREEKSFGMVFFVVSFVVLFLASLQSGYNLDRLTERHFFVITPLVFILSFHWILNRQHGLSRIVKVCVITVIIFSSSLALFLQAVSAGPAVDSAYIDSVKEIVDIASKFGLHPMAVKLAILCLSAVLTVLAVFFKARGAFALTSFVTAFMLSISVPAYSISSVYSKSVKRRHAPVIEWISRNAHLPANLVFLLVDRSIALDHIIWNKDYLSRILYEARPGLENPSDLKFSDLSKLPRSIDKRNPTYIISRSFLFDGTETLENYLSLGMSRVIDWDHFLVTGYFLDLGEPGLRWGLGKGWSQNEGPYPDLGFPSFVWAVGKTSEVEIYLSEEKSEKILRFRVFTFLKGQRMDVDVNGIHIGSIKPIKAWQEYSVPINSNYLNFGPNKITFTYKETRSPSESGSGDKRELAVAFDWIIMENAAEKASRGEISKAGFENESRG
jgi:hypothetical protein